MGKTLKFCVFCILGLSLTKLAHGLTFDDAMSRYEHDSDFTMLIDSNMHYYCSIQTVEYFGNSFTQVMGTEWRDYGNQPYEVLPSRDSISSDTLVNYRISPIIGSTKSGACFFTMIGTNGNVQESISINNYDPATKISSNAYDASEKYGWKFRYWYLADKIHLTLR